VANDDARGFNIASEKHGLTEEAYKIIKTIRQMEASLEDNKPKDNYPLESEELQVYTPLNRCVQDLKEKYAATAKVHRERFEQVKSKCFEYRVRQDADSPQNW
jgi:Ase1/PRC1/MAP65 family protein